MSNGNGNGYKYKAQDFIDAIPGSGGIVATIAKRVGCNWKTANRYIQDKPTVQAAYQDECETVNDVAESTLITSIQGGDVASAKWWLTKKRKQQFGDEISLKIDYNKLTDRQLDRIIAGEDLVNVLTSPEG